MQRNKIKVGERYAVVKRTGKHDGTIEKSVPATIVEMDVEYEGTRQGSFRSYKVPMRDGIRVRFDEPVVARHYDYEPLSVIEERGALKESVIRELRKDAITETVLHGSKYVLRPQAEVDEMRARWAEERADRKAKVDAIGDAIEPVHDAVMVALAVKSDSGNPKDVCSVKQYTAQGTEKKRITDATFTFDLEEMAKLLGIAVKIEA